MILRKEIVVLVFILFSVPGAFGQQSSLRLWFDEPAPQWEATLPLGNGRLGMTPDGGVLNEKIVLNNITLWSGAPQDANNYDAHKKLPEIRKLIIEGRNDEAQGLVNSSFVCTGKGSADEPFGCFQTLGDLDLTFTYEGVNPEKLKFQNYSRELTLNDAIARASFEVNGVKYTREYFTSFGDDVGVIRLKASEAGALNFTVSLSRAERSETRTVDDILQMSGQLDNGTDGKGMKYFTLVKVTTKDGEVEVHEKSLQVSDATEAIIFMSAGTDFRNPDFVQDVKRTLNEAESRSYQDQKQAHIDNYQQYYDRLSFKLEGPDASHLTTDERLNNFQKDRTSDNGLPVLFFQFGRYLTISSTRVGLLPPNLQGLWANQIQTPWNGDYHLDVNVQMNHWPVEVTNLSEFNLPLTELVRGLVEPGARTAKAYYQADGWVAHVVTNVWGFTEPGESASWGLANAGSGWVCNNLWQHYDFTRDKDYLKSIYPILKGSAEFYSSVMMRDPETGWLVTAPSVSPENWFVLPNGNHASICMGPTIDNQIVRELFANVIYASKELGVDRAFRKTLQEKLEQIPPVGRVGKDGTLMEWLRDYADADPQHRHISHLYGVYPASQITPASTPKLAEASKKVLEVRGDDGPSWAIAYKMIFWARLQDGNRAYKLLGDLLRPTLKTNINYGAGGGSYPNLFTAGPPFQIDGNFGGTAGIAEMLIQSHDEYIELLPALPDEWKAGGEVKGIRARGNYTVDIKWKDGKVIDYRITSPKKGKVKVKINGEIETVKAS